MGSLDDLFDRLLRRGGDEDAAAAAAAAAVFSDQWAWPEPATPPAIAPPEPEVVGPPAPAPVPDVMAAPGPVPAPLVAEAGPPPAAPAVRGGAVEPIPRLDRALAAVAPGLGPTQRATWRAVLDATLREGEIDTAQRVAAFLGQCATETGGFRRFDENLNYSAERLRVVWPRRFPTLAEAEPYARNPERLANRVYSNRLGNGHEASGDGWRFRGRGLIQLTGRDNYARFGATRGWTAEEAAARIATPEGAAASAVWFWTEKGLNALADEWALDRLTARINGGATAAQERRRLCEAARQAMGG